MMFWEVDILGSDILEVDIMESDTLEVDIMGSNPQFTYLKKILIYFYCKI